MPGRTSKLSRAVRDAVLRERQTKDDQIALLKRQIVDLQDRLMDQQDRHNREINSEKVIALDLRKEVERYRSLHYALLRYLLLINYDPANPPA